MRDALAHLALPAALALAAAGAVAAEPDAPAGETLFVLADPQIHNPYGTSLKQMFPLADWVSKVAIRPPEVNLLAPVALRDALQWGHAQEGGGSPVALVLGDGTNIGCSGEAEVFDGEFTHDDVDFVRLMAHGNHDSYMMGTVNSYGPKGPNTWTPGDMMSEPLPVDEAWWTPTDAPARQGTSLAGRNWMDACYAPARSTAGEAGTPMNKVRWLARYARSLERHGLVQEPLGDAPHEGLRFAGRGAPGTALGRLNYRSEGIWYRPRPGDESRGDDYARAWNSFSVQAVDIGRTHTLVIIDTSVCQNARGGGRFLFTNAGTRSCIGGAQFKVIRKMLEGLAADRSLVVAAHFPIKSLRWRERWRLLAMMQAARPEGWTFLSGHTHDSLTSQPYPGGKDINIGSTTDWPMEAHRLSLGADGSVEVHASRNLGEHGERLPYSLDWDLAGRYSELCRHLGAAEALAAATPEIYDQPWTSPEMDETRCDALQKDWAASSRRLLAAQARISERFDGNERENIDYREFVLRVAAAASLHESKQCRFGPDCIP